MIYTKPVWQSGSGVPADGMRDIPDVSLSAATHDGYLVTYNNGTFISGGTSCGTPSMAAILGLLNQYLVTNKFQVKTAGLGNIEHLSSTGWRKARQPLFTMSPAGTISYNARRAARIVLPARTATPLDPATIWPPASAPWMRIL